MSAVPHGQPCEAFLTPDAEEAVCAASTLRFYLTVFCIWKNSTRSFSGSAVLHWYRRHVTAKLSVRHSGAADLERSKCDDKTWTTVPSTMTTKREDTTTKSWYVVF